MRTYTTLDRTVINLDALPPDQLAFVEGALADYRRGMDWIAFNNRIYTPTNPLMGPGTTRDAWDQPAMRVLRDLDARLGIAQGRMRAVEGDEVDRDPLDDECITMSQAAERLGVSRMAVHKAASRGDVLATKDRPAKVSIRSLEAWDIDEVRQAAGRTRQRSRDTAKARPAKAVSSGR